MNHQSESPAVPMELQSASALLDMLAKRKIGAVELLDLLVQRIEHLNPALNAIVDLNVEGARIAALAADNLPQADRGPLHGLPMTIKDAYEVEGMTATCGFPHLTGFRPRTDAEPVARLRAAGAIPFGKTNVPLAAADHQSYNEVYGTSNNPWDLTRTPGGSSGGAAAAVAAGFTPLELGSDIGGSIRCPAHFCGIYGHKSSYKLVPMRGHIPPLPGAYGSLGLAVGGPLARSACDLELALDVLAGPPDADCTAWSVCLPDSRHEDLRNFRVALWADNEHFTLDSRCREAIHDYARDLRKLGVQVDDAARPEFDPHDSDDIYVAMLFAIVSAGMPEEDLRQTVDYAANRQLDNRSYPLRIARAVRTGFHEFLQLEALQQHLIAAWRVFFRDYDAVVCPIMPTVAFPHDHSGTGPGHIAQYSRTTMVDGQPQPYLNGLQWPGLVTVAHLPATAVPTGRFVDGLPVGVQLVGPYLEDRTPLRLAQLLERELGGCRLPEVSV